MIILASQSPRRKELLSWLGLSFSVRPADVDERMHSKEDPALYVLRIGMAKAEAIAKNTATGIIIAADTAVIDHDEILGKPETKEKAFAYLQQLRGREHLVISGLIIRSIGDKRTIQEICRSQVLMRQYSDDEIREYIQTGDPMDKAGAYAIQGRAAAFVRRISGSYSNVVGLPLAETWALLEGAGFSLQPLSPQNRAR